MKKISALLITVLSVITLASCMDNDPVRTDDDVKDPTNNQTELLVLTLEELAEFDGKDGAKAYIAVDGDIYDVSEVWVSGEHNGYNAGTDVSNFITSAPHGKSVLDDLEKVGELSTE